MGKTKTLEIYNNPNVGLYAYATDEYCLVGRGLPEEKISDFKKALDVPIYEITIGGSQQVGVYINGNDRGIIVPDLITESERKKLEDIGIKYTIINTKHTALSNNIIINNHYAFYMPEMEKLAIEQIENALEVKGDTLELSDWEVIGSIVVLNNKGGLVQKDVPENTIKLLQSKLKTKLEPGTVNFGSHVIGGGVVVNSFGMIIGKSSAGIEITNADMAFGFLG